MSTITSHECSDHTLVDRVKYWGRTEPNTPAFVFWSQLCRRILSRGDVVDLSSRFSYRLKELGVKHKDVVCVSLPNSPERVIAEYGIHLAGAVSMNGQLLRADGKDLIDSLIKANCTSIILDPDVTGGAWSIIRTASGSLRMNNNFATYNSENIPLFKNIIFCRTGNKENGFLKSLTLSTGEKYMYEDGKPQDTAAIFTTSGSTGYSKLVPHTHEGVFRFGFAYCHILELRPGCKFLNVSPLGWTGGFPVAFLYSGCTRVAVDESDGEISDLPALIWKIICQEKVNVALLLPSLVIAVNDQRRLSAAQQSKHQLRKIFTSGQPIKKETFNVIGELTRSVANVYGSVENALSCSVSLENTDDFEDFMIGYPFSGVLMRVVDENLKEVSPMTRGEIIVKSPGMCGGYIGADISTQGSFLPEGWFRTGDVGYVREDGCFFAEGRSSDAITHGGYILYPSWLEKELVKCPGVKDIVIVPVPDQLLHHEICACVKLDDDADVLPSADDIITFCRKQTLLPESSRLSFVPKYVVFVDAIPKTNTGKTDRKGLTCIAIANLNL